MKTTKVVRISEKNHAFLKSLALKNRRTISAEMDVMLDEMRVNEKADNAA